MEMKLYSGAYLLLEEEGKVKDIVEMPPDWGN